MHETNYYRISLGSREQLLFLSLLGYWNEMDVKAIFDMEKTAK